MPYPIQSLFDNARGGLVGADNNLIFRNTIGPNFTSPDMRALLLNTQRSKLAHDVLTQGRIKQAQDDIDRLRFASGDQIANLFTAPRNDADAALQALIQNDINAKERGVSLIPTWQTQTAHDKAILSNQNLADDLFNQQFSRNLHAATLAQQQARDFANMLNQEQQRQHAQKQLDLEREKTGFQQMIQREGLDRAGRAEERQDARALQQSYVQLQQAVRSGAMSADEAIAALPQLTSAQQAALRGYDTSNQERAAQAQRYADRYNSELNRLPSGLPAVEPSWRNLWQGGEAKPPTDDEIRAYQQNVIESLNRDSIARKQIQYDPESGAFVSTIRMSPPTAFELMLRNRNYADLTGGPDTEQGQPELPYSPPGAQPPTSNQGIPTNLRDGTYRAPDGTTFRVSNGVRYRL